MSCILATFLLQNKYFMLLLYHGTAFLQFQRRAIQPAPPVHRVNWRRSGDVW